MKNLYGFLFLICISVTSLSCSNNNATIEENEVQKVSKNNIKANNDEIIKLPTNDNYSLRKLVYDWKYENLKKLYEKETDTKTKELLELSIYNSQQFNDVYNKVFSQNNPYKPEIYYSKEINEFKYKDIIYKIVDSRSGRSGLPDDLKLIKPNVDADEFNKSIEEISNEFYIETYEKVYKLDIDMDGKDEYICFYSYKAGDGWVIYEIEEGKQFLRNKNIFYDNLHWNLIDVYKYQGMYLFISEDHVRIYDGDETYEIYLEFVDKLSTIVLSDIYKDIDNESYTDYLAYAILDIMRFSFEKYIREVGQKIVASEEILEGFGKQDDIIDNSINGEIDFNNDGIADYSMTNWYAYGNIKASGNKSIVFLDGKTKEVVDLETTYDENISIQTVTPKYINGKNYFLVQYAISYPRNDVHVFKLIEFVENKPVIVRELLVTTYGYIHVRMN